MKHIISVSETAVSKLGFILKEHNKSVIRFSVKGGGCNGFNYRLKPTNKPAEKLDEVVKIDNVEIHVCNSSVMHLLGTKIDYVSEDYSNGIFENKFIFTPDKNKASSCGCGVSFNPKE